MRRIDRLLLAVAARIPHYGKRLTRLVESIRVPQPGEFYSPVPSLPDVRERAAKIFDLKLRDLPGIELNVDGQLETLDRLQTFYRDQPFAAERTDGLRYFFNNKNYGYGDGLFLHCVIRWARPRRIVEIGSGFSSCLMLDTNERFFDGKIAITLVEPYDALLRSLLKKGDAEAVEIVTRPVQDVPLELIERLAAGDILFVDSSHVAKVGSDVRHIFAEVLPRLAPGVLVHFHDIFYPFEYRQAWVEKGIFWNEAYLLHAFLQFNAAFEIVIWNNFLGNHFRDRLGAAMPLALQNFGASIWIRRRR